MIRKDATTRESQHVTHSMVLLSCKLNTEKMN